MSKIQSIKITVEKEDGPYHYALNVSALGAAVSLGFLDPELSRIAGWLTDQALMENQPPHRLDRMVSEYETHLKESRRRALLNTYCAEKE